MAAQSGIAGSTIIGKKCRIGGQAGINGHLSIGDNVHIGGGSVVIKSFKDNERIWGNPAYKASKSIRIQALLKQLVKE